MPLSMLAFARYFIDIIPNLIEKFDFSKNNFFIVVSPMNLYKLITIMKKHGLFSFSSFGDFFSIDFLTSNLKNKKRFCFFISLVSFFFCVRFFLKFNLSNLYLSSLITFFKSVEWLEREIWDLFGIFFSNNYDLRRILTDYGFQGFPLRKDFPVTGFYEQRYNDMLKRIVFLDICLIQEYRNMEFINPWL